MADEDEDEKNSHWYNNLIFIDFIIFLGSFLFLAIAGGIMYVCYPPVMMAFQT